MQKLLSFAFALTLLAPSTAFAQHRAARRAPTPVAVQVAAPVVEPPPARVVVTAPVMRRHTLRLASGIAGVVAGGVMLGLAYGQMERLTYFGQELGRCRAAASIDCTPFEQQSAAALQTQYLFAAIGIGGLVVGALVTVLSIRPYSTEERRTARWTLTPSAPGALLGAGFSATF